MNISRKVQIYIGDKLRMTFQQLFYLRSRFIVDGQLLQMVINQVRLVLCFSYTKFSIHFARENGFLILHFGVFTIAFIKLYI